MCLLSVILTTYKSPWEKIALTLDSIFSQNLNDFEIIIADDGTHNFPLRRIESYMRDKSPQPYRIIHNTKNVGTVRNVLNAAQKASGVYIKPIGAGDLLYNNKILKEVTEYMIALKSECCFGLIRGYVLEGDQYKTVDIKRPRVIQVYEENDQKQIKENIILGDHPSGASMFYKRESAIRLWSHMVENTKTLYCEDVVTYQLVLEGGVPSFYPHYVVWYEVNAGVSKRAKKSRINTMMYTDILTYLEYLIQAFPCDKKLLLKKLKWSKFQVMHPYHIERFLSYIWHPGKLWFELYVRNNSYSSTDFID